MSTRSLSLAVLAFFLLVFQNVGMAQTGNIDGKLYTFGFLFIKWGNPGQNTIILENNAGFSMTAQSDSKGKFVFNSVPVGNYSIRVDCKAELKDIGLCNMSGSAKVSVKKNKTSKISIKVFKM